MPRLPHVEGACAFFFDFDGTLVDIAPRPDAVHVEPRVPLALQALQLRCAGAVAVVSGRPIAEIDTHLSPACLPAAGVHGVERRRADGGFDRIELPDLEPARALLTPWVAAHPGARLETKPGALALHYRGADALENACRMVMQQAQALVRGAVLLHGKKVIELKPAMANKGRAVQAFMAEHPFMGRRAWYFGDDVTDEAGFAAVRGLGGVTVKIGDGETAAAWRLPDPAAVRDWLQAVS